ncbi:efflux RND transporter periplasmic adaptor subunit [Sphingobacterium sp. DN00404]|uniref:Efflux RND transporter periplasmic adaptor subunit n=1 Tax=Sphingobacterium micropteri TaxID=2763501 RepID=A0ABR7YNF5_9SPHI|nr:efflux RND transporter periplasmic adaptor subunit [Sphingobacterium micropteri]MBD1432878.1 efflux RND transporter periplasmic adaptor subunit [Sphingobacterium micropteri]
MIRKRNLCRLWFISGILSLACSGSAEEQRTAERHVQALPPTETAEVKAFLLQEVVFNHELISNGTIVASQKADLRFEEAEVVEEIFVKNGQRVQKGQKIAQLAQFKLQNALKQASDNLEKAKLELQDVLISQGFTLADSLKVPEETMKIAKIKSNYEYSLIQYELAKHSLSRSVLYAPYDGVIANLSAKKYNLPPSNEPFCTIIANDAMDAQFTVLETELPLIRQGDRVELSPFSIQNYQATAVIDEINPLVDENGMVKVKARIRGAAQGLYEGMNIRVRVQRSAGKQLIVPKEALVLRNNRKVVFTTKSNQALWNYVTTGLENATGYVITEGLQVGDSVIYEGNLNLAHETPVKVLR